MSFDKLFDGSDAHLLGANAELIADLRERINPAYADMRGTESYERKLCADALELADKRIAELEALLLAQPFRSEREKEAERKLAVAREALEKYGRHDKNCEAVTEAVSECCGCGLDESLAQIGGDDAAS